MKRTIYLHGPLASTFTGEPIELHCRNLRELFAGLTSRFPTFKRELLKYPDMALMMVDGDHVTYLQEDELHFDFGSAPELHLGVGNRAGGAEAAAYVAAYFAEGTFAYYAAYAITYVVVTAAIAYAVSAVVTSLADTVSTEETKRKQEKSTLFNGATNNPIQGGRVQLVYGRFEVGSVTLTQEIEAIRQSIGLNDTLTVNGNTTGTMNVFSNDSGLTSPSVVNYTYNGTTYSVGSTVTVTGGWTFSINSAGLVSVDASSYNGEGDITVAVHCTDTTNTFDNQLRIRIQYMYDFRYDGGGGDGPGSGPGDGGAGDGGSSGDGE